MVQDSHVPTHVTVHHHAGEPEGDSGRFDDLVAKLLTLHGTMPPPPPAFLHYCNSLTLRLPRPPADVSGTPPEG